MKVETTAEALLFSTCRIETTHEEGTGASTGFIYDVPVTSGKRVPFVVTNKHVVRDAEHLNFRLFARTEQGSPSLKQTVTVDVNGEALTIIRWHPKHDVAVLPLIPLLRMAGIDPDELYYQGLTPDICQGPGGNAWLNAIEEVTLVGYPNGLYDTVNNVPIVRRGITATPPRLNYGGEPSFLVDAAVYPGSSGSPVFLYESGLIRDTPKLDYRVGERTILLGILAAGPLRQVYGTVGLADEEALSAQFDDVMNLGVVYKPPVWHRCAQEFVESQGLSIVKGSL